MKHIYSYFLLAPLVLAATYFESTSEDYPPILLVQVEKSLRHPGYASNTYFKASPTNVTEIQPALERRLPSRVLFIRAASGNASGNATSDDFVLIGAFMIAIIIGIVFLGCIFFEANKQESFVRDDVDSLPHSGYARNGISHPLPHGRKGSVNRTPSEQAASPQLQNRTPAVGFLAPLENRTPPQQSKSLQFQNRASASPQQGFLVPVENPNLSRPDSRLDSPQKSESSNHSTLAERPAPNSSSLLGRQTKTSSSLGSDHGTVDVNSNTGMLKPLCHALVLNVKTRFMMPFHDLVRAHGTVPVLAESSRKTLLLARIDLDAANGGGTVSLSWPASASLPEGLASVGTIKSTGKGFMRITDHRGDLYGDFKYAGNLEYRLFTGGKETAALNYERGASSTHNVHISTKSGANLAHAFKRGVDGSKEGQSEEYLEVSVEKGMDSVLALLCVLGAMILG